MDLKTKIASAACFVCFAWGPATGAQTIAGAVRNLTTAQPASGDDVILLRLGNGMEEQARTKTDAQGTFTLTEREPGAQYVVRVMHQGVNYDKAVIGAVPLEIRVADALPTIKDLRGSIGMVQMESDGKILRVTEMYGITNASNPPVTQAGPRNFEIFLPPGAAFDSMEASRGGGVWTKISPKKVPGQPRVYAVNFPIRPGDTLFRAVYRLPYSEHMSFHLKVPYPIQKFAVIHPQSMTFHALRRGVFLKPQMVNGMRMEEAVSQPLVGKVPAFAISGVGTAPPPPPVSAHESTPQAPPSSIGLPAASAQATVDGAKNHKSATGGANLSRTTLWISLLGVAGFLGCGAWLAWRARRTRSQPASPRRPLVDVLKEELFQLEVDRAQGSISPEEYAATKQALNLTLQRTVAKTAADS